MLSMTTRRTPRRVTRSWIVRSNRSRSSCDSSSRSKPSFAVIAGRSTRTSEPSSISEVRKNSKELTFWSSLAVASVTDRNRERSPRSAPRIRNSRVSVVLPVPTLPATSTMFPRGIPP